MAPQYDTIVVGLGPAGCTAAATLARAGRRVLALEAQGRVGGRVMTVPFGDGVVELGAEWVHGTKQSRIYDFAINSNVPMNAQDLRFEIFRSDGSKTDQNLVNELLEFCLNVVDDPPQTPGPLGQYITIRLNDYIKKNHPQLYKDKVFIDEFINFMDLIVDNYESSNSWNDVSTDTQYEELEGEQHMSWHRQGFRTMFDIILNTYNNGPGYPNLDIKLSREVTQIAWPQETTQNVEVTCKDGDIYTANNVIVTVSIGVLKASHKTLFSPPLPTEKVKIIDDISIGVVDKIIVSFDEVWWPKSPSFFGFLWSVEQRRKLTKDEYWITNIFGASSPLGSNNVLTLWTSGDGAKHVETLPDDVVKRKVIKLLRKFMGANITIPEPSGIVRSFWYSNPFTRGSYSFDNLKTPLHPNARVDLGQPLTDKAGKPRVLFAGEATDRTHFSTVHGATDTGYREAKRLLPASKI